MNPKAIERVEKIALSVVGGVLGGVIMLFITAWFRGESLAGLRTLTSHWFPNWFTLGLLLAAILGWSVNYSPQKQKIREQLYREISHNHLVLVTKAMKRNPLESPYVFGGADEFEGLSFKVWNHYEEPDNKAALFKLLKEAGDIARIYEGISNIAGAGIIVPGAPRNFVGKSIDAADEVDRLLLEGRLDRKTYRRQSSPEAVKLLDELVSGKRPRIGAWRK
jgi:hypothetical protein